MVDDLASCLWLMMPLCHAELGGLTQGALDSNGQPVDAQFYALFWGLQAVFQQPYSAMEPSKWATTIADIKRVLAEFAKQVRPPSRLCNTEA